MNSLIQRFRLLPGKSVVAKAEYALWRILRRRLISTGAIYENGEPFSMLTKVGEQNRQCVMPTKIVCVTGFGHSGSGVITDLLSEYDGVSIQGFVDKNGSLRQGGGMEFDILRHAGGIFDIENAIQRDNPFVQDSVVKQFMALVASYYYNPRCYYREILRLASRKFLDEIVDYIVPTPDGYEYCPHLRMLGDRGFRLLYESERNAQGVFALRKMNVDEYRSVAKRYVSLLLSKLSTAECLLLDQAVSDGSAEIEKYKAYLGAIKLIAVYRDPRDVFVTGIQLHENWIPHESKTFVQWYKRQVEPYRCLKDDDFLLLRFEDLVTKYDESVSIVENFIGISSSTHVNQRSGFDPMVSRKNIGIYKVFVNQDDVGLIQRDLEDYCFNG